jgi:hypothetical protein
MIKHLVSQSVDGDYFTWRKFDRTNPTHREKIEPLIRSLNLYLPRFLEPMTPDG